MKTLELVVLNTKRKKSEEKTGTNSCYTGFLLNIFSYFAYKLIYYLLWVWVWILLLQLLLLLLLLMLYSILTSLGLKNNIKPIRLYSSTRTYSIVLLVPYDHVTAELTNNLTNQTSDCLTDQTSVHKANCSLECVHDDASQIIFVTFDLI